VIIELHILQSFAPSNLNRDDTGAPKDCDFGGVRRARVSSQSLKRAMRRAFEVDDLVPPELRATRTKRVIGLIADALSSKGQEGTTATALATSLLAAGGIKSTEGQVGALMFVGRDEIDALADLALSHAEQLLAAQPQAENGEKPRGRKGAAGLPYFKKAVADALKSRSVDIALFGRMIAELPDGNVDASAQVAHAISTHRVELDFDYYTAMDDLATPGETGAAMVDTVEFNAATYYRYANVDVNALVKHLGDRDRVHVALVAFLRAAIVAEPTGKQNSFAAHNPPSYVLAVVRNGAAWSLANAFLRPVRASGERDLVDRSIEELETYWAQLAKMYGTQGLRVVASAADRELPAHGAIERVANVDALLSRALEAALGGAA
jgi:CRISPR system Cascade subunit CasC